MPKDDVFDTEDDFGGADDRSGDSADDMSWDDIDMDKPEPAGSAGKGGGDAKAAEARAEIAEQKQSESSEEVAGTTQHQDKTAETAAFSPFDKKENETEGTARLNSDKPEEKAFTKDSLSHRYSIEAYRQNQQAPSSGTSSTVSGGLLSLRA